MDSAIYWDKKHPLFSHEWASKLWALNSLIRDWNADRICSMVLRVNVFLCDRKKWNFNFPWEKITNGFRKGFKHHPRDSRIMRDPIHIRRMILI